MRYILLTLLCFLLTINLGHAQHLLNAKGGFNAAKVTDNSDNSNEFRINKWGLQAGLGVIMPFCRNWFFAPMLWCTQGGQAFKDEDFEAGSRTNFLQVSAGVGYTINLGNSRHALQLEAAPVYNYWSSATTYNNFSGTREENKLDLSENDNISRSFVSGAAELSFLWRHGWANWTFGLRGEMGLTPLQKVEDSFSGETTKFYTHSIALIIGISNPFNDLLGRNRE